MLGRSGLIVPTSNVVELVEGAVGIDVVEGATTLVLSPVVMEEVAGFGVVIRAAVIVASWWILV